MGATRAPSCDDGKLKTNEEPPHLRVGRLLSFVSVGGSTVEAVEVRLTIRDAMLLTIAAAHYKHAGIRDTDFRELTGYSPTIASQRVNWLIDQPFAMEVMPLECRRLRDLREARRAYRSARRAG